MEIAITMVGLGLLVFSAHLFASIYNRKKIPDVLLLILIGLILGPILGWITPESLGVGGPVFVTLTLVVILFEGGTSLSFEVLKSAWKSTLNIVLSCFFVSMLVVTGVSSLFGMGLLEGLILGAILGGTSSAVVIPLVKSLHLTEKSKTVLIIESAATDVLCIVFALAFMQAVKMGTIDIGNVIGNIISSFSMAGVLGFLGALIWSRLITRMRKLQNSIFTTPAFVFIIYGVAELLGYSGAIASLVFGITMANIDTINNRILKMLMGGRGHRLNHTEMVFFGEIAFVLKTLFFVYIGVSITFDDWLSILVGLIITVLLFMARLVLTRWVVRDDSPVFDKTIISMMIPKGLAAAVLASMPVSMGLEGGAFIQNVTYSVIFFSILMVSVMILVLDKSRTVRRFYQRYWLGKKGMAEQSQDADILFSDKSEDTPRTISDQLIHHFFEQDDDDKTPTAPDKADESEEADK